MKLSSLIKNLYQQIFIGVVIQHKIVRICVQLHKGNKIEEEIHRQFEISQGKLNQEVNDYLRTYMGESPYVYIAVLNDANNQGAVPTCSMAMAGEYDDLGSSVTLCYEDKWMVFSEKSELNSLQRRFAASGIDYIFSPFFILSHFFADKIEGKTSLLVLVQEDYLSLAIFAEGELLFAKHYMTHDGLEDENMSAELGESTEESLGFSLEDDEDLSINLDDIDALDELDALDDLDNLQDLDDLDDLDEIEDFEESLNEAVEESEAALEEAKTKYDSKIDNFSDDYKRFQLIQGLI